MLVFMGGEGVLKFICYVMFVWVGWVGWERNGMYDLCVVCNKVCVKYVM
jgi:hypothetical protein